GLTAEGADEGEPAIVRRPSDGLGQLQDGVEAVVTIGVAGHEPVHPFAIRSEVILLPGDQPNPRVIPGFSGGDHSHRRFSHLHPFPPSVWCHETCPTAHSPLTSGRISSSRFLPIPLILSRSTTDRYGLPLMIRRALTGPIPGRASNSDVFAVLTLV